MSETSSPDTETATPRSPWPRRLMWIALSPVLVLLWLVTMGASYFMASGEPSVPGVLSQVALWTYVAATLYVLVRHTGRTWVFVAVTFAVALIWWNTREARTDRDWVPSVARMPWVEFEGDLAHVHEIRNFRYRTPDDFDVAYYDRTYDLGKLETADLMMVFWDGNTAIAHSMISFGFEGGEQLCLSIEIRGEVGEEVGALPGLFKQLEVLYILADERDVVNLRTSYRPEDVYLYRLDAEPSEVREYLEQMLHRCNDLRENPAFYGTLEHNCFTSLTALGKKLWPDRPRETGLRQFLNGYAAEYAHRHGQLLDGGLPFAELKKRSYVTPIGATIKDDPDYSRKLRADLPWQPVAAPDSQK